MGIGFGDGDALARSCQVVQRRARGMRVDGSHAIWMQRAIIALAVLVEGYARIKGVAREQ